MTRNNRNNSNEEELLSFRTTNPDGKFVRERLVGEPLRYFTTAKCLRKPAEVTDKLRKAHGRLAVYNRDYMKGGVARLLKEDEVREPVVRFFESQGANGTFDGSDNEDELVSLYCNSFLSSLYFIVLFLTVNLPTATTCVS